MNRFLELIWKALSAGLVGVGSKAVTTAATAVQLSATSVPCHRVVITANAANTGVIVVGNASVVASASTATSRKGIPLVASQQITLFVSDLSMLWLDATVSGEGVSFAYFN